MAQITKEELVDEMLKHYRRMIDIAEVKYKSAMEVEENKEAVLNINSRTKKENTDLKEYNQQVSALGVITSKIIAIMKSDIVSAESEEEDEELV